MNREIKIFLILLSVFLTAYFMPLGVPKVQAAILDAFRMLQWYAIYHTLACVVPAMFIAGAIATFLSKEAILKHLGPKANPVESYGVASVSGTILAVCSCSVLPMFAGIYRVGAGLGPAATFLCAGPALNVMAIFLTARVLGVQLGVTRTLVAIVMSIVVGISMAWIFRRSEKERIKVTMQLPDPLPSSRKLWQTAAFLAVMVSFLVFSDWVNPVDTLISTEGNVPTNYRFAATIFEYRLYLCLICALILAFMITRWFNRDEIKEWLDQTWTFSKQIIPLLFGGVFVTGFVASLLPAEIVARFVGGNSIQANVIASVIGSFWYFATLTEIPLMQALLDLGMGKGPALALLLAGPTLSLPSIIVIGKYLGAKKTAVFVFLVAALSALSGLIFGTLV